MDKSIQLEKFVNQIMSLDAPVLNIFGSGLPGNAGLSVAQEGASNTGMDLSWQLKKNTIAFANALKNGNNKEASRLAKLIEGNLLNEELINILNQENADELLDELNSIIRI